MGQTDTQMYEKMTDYELCALYCDFYEWLNHPVSAPVGPRTEDIRSKYKGKAKLILEIIAGRHGYKPEDAEQAMLAQSVGLDPTPDLREMSAGQLEAVRDNFAELVRYCDEVLKEKGEG